MYKLINGKYYFHHVKKGKEYSDPNIPEYCNYLREYKGASLGTLEKYIGSIHKFWIYALYFPSDKDQTIQEYATSYRTVLATKGFVVREIVKESSYNFEMTKIIYTAKKIADPNSDMIALQSFYQFMTNPKVNPTFELIGSFPIDIYYDKLNDEQMDIKDKYSKGHGYGLKSRGIMRRALTAHLNVFTNLINKKYSRKNTQNRKKKKAFKYEVFEALLEVADTRDKLLYILCGGTSARIGQALNLTKYDVDLLNKRVYLIPPGSHLRPQDTEGYAFLGQPPRIELLAKYGIDSNKSPHNLNRFKYPIPTEDDENGFLHFLTDQLRDMFLETYSQLSREITPNNPFIFQTSTGRYIRSEAHDNLKKNLAKVKDKYPQFTDKELDMAFHGFRHMYGQIMASIAYYLQANSVELTNLEMPDGRSTNIIELWKTFTRRKMGQSSPSSIDIYFNPESYVMDYALDLVKENMEGMLNLGKRIRSSILQ